MIFGRQTLPATPADYDTDDEEEQQQEEDEAEWEFLDMDYETWGLYPGNAISFDERFAVNWSWRDSALNFAFIKKDKFCDFFRSAPLGTANKEDLQLREAPEEAKVITKQITKSKFACLYDLNGSKLICSVS